MSAVRSPYDYILTLYKRDGSGVGQAPLEVDWEAAWHWAAFEGFRRGVFGHLDPGGPAIATPIWHGEAGEPHLAGFSMAIAADGSDTPAITCVIPFGYFKRYGLALRDHYVEKGWLERAEEVWFGVTAFASQASEHAGPPQPFTVEEERQPLRLKSGARSDFMRRSVPAGSECPEEVPAAFIPQHVLDETAELARQAGSSETGGILVGHLVREAGDHQDVFVEVTSQVHARRAVGSPTQLTFTAESWEAVEAALRLRGRGEIWLGWWHSHPREVSEAFADAPVAFMSTRDCAIHRGCFPRAYSVALVVTEDPRDGELVPTLFGWHCGIIAARGFHILGGQRPDDGAETLSNPPEQRSWQ